MAPAAAVLTLAFVLRARGRRRGEWRWRWLMAAPVGWATWQHHASGRYSLGTSIDGINLHKGNDAVFLEHYPPRTGTRWTGSMRG